MAKLPSLKVGEKVFFIPHGVGVVDRFEKKKILDENREYMIVKIMANEMTVMLPMNDQFPFDKIRKITSKKELEDVYEILQAGEKEIEKNWKTRKENNQQLLLSGNLNDFAEIVKTLYEKNKEKPLSYTEKGLIKKVFTFMVNEVSIILKKDGVDVVKILLEKLGEDFEMNQYLMATFRG